MNLSQEQKMNGLPKLQGRYARRSREGKSRMLDELCEDHNYERKYAIKLLSGGLPAASGRGPPGPERLYAVIEPVVQHLWLAAAQPCGKRLVPIHNGTFDLALHAWTEPLEQVTKLSAQRDVAISTPRFGERLDIGSPDP